MKSSSFLLVLISVGVLSDQATMSEQALNGAGGQGSGPIASAASAPSVPSRLGADGAGAREHPSSGRGVGPPDAAAPAAVEGGAQPAVDGGNAAAARRSDEGGGVAAGFTQRPASLDALAKKADRAGANEAFLARVTLNEMDSWCYHEGSYGHNPEFGSTHTLSAIHESNGKPSARAATAAAAHTKTDYDDKGGNVRRSEANGATTFWRIHTTGEAQVPKDVSPTEAIGHGHEVLLEGDKLSVVVHYYRAGKSKTTELSVAALWNEYQSNGKKEVGFKL